MNTRWVCRILLVVLCPSAAAVALDNIHFETDANTDNWPDGWSKQGNAVWEVTGSGSNQNHYVVLREPGQAGLSRVWQNLGVTGTGHKLQFSYAFLAHPETRQSAVPPDSFTVKLYDETAGAYLASIDSSLLKCILYVDSDGKHERISGMLEEVVPGAGTHVIGVFPAAPDDPHYLPDGSAYRFKIDGECTLGDGVPDTTTDKIVLIDGEDVEYPVKIQNTYPDGDGDRFPVIAEWPNKDQGAPKPKFVKWKVYSGFNEATYDLAGQIKGDAAECH